MLVRPPVRGQTKWFLRRLSVDQRSHLLEGLPNRGRPVLDGWVSRLGCLWRGSQFCRGQTFASCGAFFFKRLVRIGTRYPVHWSQRSLPL
ncbi:hypothetical protein E2C01_095830 [Portunus trituberculatus]|uniref:Uncharacterized protein n=1 Tax=Portunus trituberculatus TaxID=210409 RepID=A0A5B7K162_PORTR|nr:hypothetical protein [Portunus trituberculatus]